MRDYNVSVSYDDYFANANKIVSENIEVVGDSIMFYTDKETIDLIEQKNIRYMLHYSKKNNVFNFFKYRTGILVGMLVVIFMIVINKSINGKDVSYVIWKNGVSTAKEWI